ncbi:bifunctional hydroxymethylpyrimidine kinase/phosphomethylpyrimidine kinase [Alicyclobacillus fastidiosus]|uniref:Hydroxymethylpyrimidine/phosphomethylpyrimidine kinase n=1 Tax=Alicyclobacillus fastidiosus TaxID=392011 RepID=A0ABY6ZK90_9BACL|nr:bifunctional hydroxymethylpyrimidine kinase/phosphomethylpyrimidine kinase [Alicyclobacillus fastidiosus]WAH43272.1 bifunctional hydroxymethylpyrimidine kinase/phosphomethylpyrimidine kinase [Alicyclobacillus fastidiosus]GMA65319.1 hydroxymethylpyrimidine/phosphomethylpyrimidine kinase [Alicyclobacillus fastidiosus]
MIQHANGHVSRALTIAGSDSGGGAGIQADLKTMHQFGVYGMSVITALTAQNTTGVRGVVETDAAFVAEQLQAVFSDLGADAIKTGMLANAEIIDTVAGVLQARSTGPLVVDPVMVAKGGTPLIANAAVDLLRSRLLPIAKVVTPNTPEASVLAGFEVDTWDDVHRAADCLLEMGTEAVVIKGGHLQMQNTFPRPWRVAHNQAVAVDTVLYQGTYTYFLTPRVDSQNTHGTGCTFSAAITARLAQGVPLLEAIADAKAFIYRAIVRAANWDVGHGHGPTDHGAEVSAVECAVEPGGAYLYDFATWTRIG